MAVLASSLLKKSQMDVGQGNNRRKSRVYRYVAPHFEAIINAAVRHLRLFQQAAMNI